MPGDRLHLHPSAPVSTDFIVAQINEHHPRITNMVVAYDYVDEERRVVSKCMISENNVQASVYLTALLRSMTDKMLRDLLA